MYTIKPEPASTNLVGSVYRITPALPVGALASPQQELDAKTAQLVVGREYIAQISAKLSDNTYVVKLSGQQVQDLTLKMDLGSQVKLGQTLSLQYMHGNPALTFMLKQPAVATPLPQTGTAVNLSNAGSLIGQYLQQAQVHQVPTRYEASGVVTRSPLKPELIAQDLKNAIARTGLFYESHLQEATQGQHSISQLKQEPQNQANFSNAAMLFQQLAILENQRLAWQGEIWAGQKMALDVYAEDVPVDADDAAATSEDRPMASELTIDFPHLGKVTAKLSLAGGRMRIQLESDTPQTATLLQNEKIALAEAVTKNGLALDALTVRLPS